MSKSEPRSDLAVLIRDLAARHHKGILYRMAPRVGLSMSLLDQWSKGLVREPSLGSLRKLAAAYGLDLSVVLEAAYPELRKKAATSVSRRCPTRDRARLGGRGPPSRRRCSWPLDGTSPTGTRPAGG